MLNKEQGMRFCELRRKLIASEFETLNPEQRSAVLTTQGPLLLLAGAGSGKTTVLINRILNLVKYGMGSDSLEVSEAFTEEDLDWLEDYCASPYEEGEEYARYLCSVDKANPWNILAITFTNKAANEIKERLRNVLGDYADSIWASTFHSCCVRILRRDIDKLGISSNFTIYDTQDCERLVKAVEKDLGMNDKQFPPKMVLGVISKAKDAMLLANDYYEQKKAEGDFRLIKVGEIYKEYERRMWESNALDFDDLILHTVRLLQNHKEVREHYQKQFKYVLIDEYQDTNQLQYLLSSTLAGGYGNFCVVGDDDQSIYKFRGATIENILSFEKQHPGCRTIRLEQNYRSTQNILEAANAVIRNNTNRKGKELWTSQKNGDKVFLYTAANENDEAQFIASQIIKANSEGQSFKGNAILYRMNAQSRQIEDAFKRNGIPYKIVGGTRFFERAEIKDIVAYLCVINNPYDDLRLNRIINVPPRGLGAKTLETLTQVAMNYGRSQFEVLAHIGEFEELKKAAPKFALFVDMINELRESAATKELPDFYEELLTKTGYLVMLEEKNTEEDKNRIENVRELLSSINEYIKNSTDEPSLAGFLDEISLYTDLDNAALDDDMVTMMTIHSAKGLEFPVVYVCGVEEGIFPGLRAIGEQDEMEEERRLCYVAMTRAKKRLVMSCAKQRMLFGHTSNNLPSRFLNEIPDDFLERKQSDILGYNHAEGYFDDYRRSGNEFRNSYDDGDYRGRPSRTQSAYTNTQYSYKNSYKKDFTTSIGNGIKTDFLELRKGDSVDHTAFGRGMVLSVTKMGGDALVEIAFDNVGTKKLMLKSASKHMKII